MDKLIRKLFLALVLVAVFLIILLILNIDNGMDSVCFNGKCVYVEIADSPSERQEGLMNREELPPDQGMLFIFEDEAIHSFWMKNTLIPLDMIWVNSTYEIVNIEHAMPCIEDPCYVYTPSKPAKYVVEVNGGFAEENGIKVGDEVNI